MSDSDEDCREKQIKIVVIGDGASGKVFAVIHSLRLIDYFNLNNYINISPPIIPSNHFCIALKLTYSY